MRHPALLLHADRIILSPAASPARFEHGARHHRSASGVPREDGARVDPADLVDDVRIAAVVGGLLMIQRITLPPLEWVMTTRSVMRVLMKLVSWPASNRRRAVHMYCSKSQLMTV